jgi:heptosyltransferase II
MKILLVQTSFLGDNILSTPVIAGVKALYPSSELSVLTTPLAAPIYSSNPDISETLLFDKRRDHAGIIGLRRCAQMIRAKKFDIAYSLHRSARTALLLFMSDIPTRIGFKEATLSFLYTSTKRRPVDVHEVVRNVSLLAPEYDSQNTSAKLVLPAANSPRSIFEELHGSAIENYTVLVPGSVWATKRWSAHEYRKTARCLSEAGKTVVLLGAPDELEIARQVADGLSVVNLTGKTSLAQMFTLIRHADLVVCNDSMSLHVASAFKVPTVVVFCATSPLFGFGPWQNQKARIVEKSDLHCKPCRRHGSHSCPEGTNACMELVSSNQVMAAIEEVMELRG